MTAKEKLAHKKWQERCDEVDSFLKKLSQKGIRASVQFTVGHGVTHITTMCASEVLGAVESAKAITLSGMRANQSFDSFLQSIEKRPDLIPRLNAVLGKLSEKGPQRVGKKRR